MLERHGEQIPLDDAQRDRRVTRHLHDFLAPAIFTRQAAELWNHRGEQLQHDRRTDVGHDA